MQEENPGRWIASAARLGDNISNKQTDHTQGEGECNKPVICRRTISSTAAALADATKKLPTINPRIFLFNEYNAYNRIWSIAVASI